MNLIPEHILANCNVIIRDLKTLIFEQAKSINANKVKKSYKCQFCHFVALSSAGLEKHIREHFCPKQGITQNDEQHSQNTSIFSNDLTLKTLNGSENETDVSNLLKLEISNALNLQTKKKPYKCPLCIYRAASKSTLNQHMRRHTGEKPFKCMLCEYQSTTRLGLQVHMGKHTGNKPFQCPYCQYKASLISGLKVHLKTHTGERPFQCPQCEYKASQKIHIIVHLRRHTGEKPYQCPECDYRATQKSNLDWHSRIHSGYKTPKKSLDIKLELPD